MTVLSLKTRFIIRLVRNLHQYGASSYRLEGAISSVSRDLGVRCDLFSGVTSCFLSISDEDAEDEQTTTRVLRLEPGAINLSRLSLASGIADKVAAGTLTPEKGIQLLDNIASEVPDHKPYQVIAASGITSAGVAALFSGSWWDLGASFIIGLVIGTLTSYGSMLNRQGSLEAFAALTAGILAVSMEAFIPGLSREIVIIAGLIVLMPGLSLTTAMAELATKHLVSGTARLAGSAMSLLKLTFGVVLGSYLASFLPLTPRGGEAVALPEWFFLLALLPAGWGSAYLYCVRRRDMPAALLAAIFSYVSAKYATAVMGPDFGIFIAGLLVASLGNLFSRITQRPASVIRVPGIILLVPGGMGFRGVMHVFNKDAITSIDSAMSLIIVLISLVAGLLFGNALVSPRRSL